MTPEQEIKILKEQVQMLMEWKEERTVRIFHSPETRQFDVFNVIDCSVQ